MLESVFDLLRKGLQPADDQLQLSTLLGGILQLPSLLLERAQALSQVDDPPLEIGLLDIPLRIGVQQPADALGNSGDSIPNS